MTLLSSLRNPAGDMGEVLSNHDAARQSEIQPQPRRSRRFRSIGARDAHEAIFPSIGDKGQEYELSDVNQSRMQNPVGGAAKRAFDVSAALGGLIVLAPIMLFVALLVLVTMGRPVFFAQQRVGFGRSSFRCFKFRTMVRDAQEKLAQYLAENPEAAAAWRDTQKLKHDPRVTWLGGLLRKTSLDELPQLWNILRGEMSCVGPRPVLSSELARYGAHAEDYAMAKPGLTGIWQVSGRSNTTYAHRVNCDRFYVRRWSFGLDMMIILRTIPAVMRVHDTA
jgi:exopolysaccharide production protein ExoY